jgi:hypothetical protein
MANYTPYLKFLAQVLNQAVFVALCVGALFGLVAGLLLLLDSARAFRVADRMDRWVSTRAALRPLEEHRSIARPLYRMHRLTGLLICAGALYVLSILASPAGEAAIFKSLQGLGPARFSAWASDSLRYVLIAGNAFAFAFGVAFVVRPSALKRLEAWADRSVSARRPVKPLEEMHRPADRFFRAHPRLAGALVVAGSLYVLATLGYAALR